MSMCNYDFDTDFFFASGISVSCWDPNTQLQKTTTYEITTIVATKTPAELSVRQAWFHERLGKAGHPLELKLHVNCCETAEIEVSAIGRTV